MQEKTAILIFGNTAAREASVKNFTLGGGQQRNQQIAEYLIRKTYATAYQSGLPVLSCSSDQQTGDTFGERLANAIEGAYSLGYQEVITIGTDSPELSADHLLQAQQLLKQGAAVYGPASDGGVYLIGLHAETYDREQFLSLAWQGEELQTSIAHTHKQAIAWLGEACDIDTAEDLQHYLTTTTSSWGVQIRRLLSSPTTHQSYFSVPLYIGQFLQSLQHRGPPQVAIAA
ncbi:MAG: DUF2064 domain-containing protein [Bacteroidota bacterium]